MKISSLRARISGHISNWPWSTLFGPCKVLAGCAMPPGCEGWSRKRKLHYLRRNRRQTRARLIAAHQS